MSFMIWRVPGEGMKLFFKIVVVLISLHVQSVKALDDEDNTGALNQLSVSVIQIPLFQIHPDRNDPALVELKRNTLVGSGYGMRISQKLGGEDPKGSALSSLTLYSLELEEEGTEEKGRGYSLNYSLLGEFHNSLPVDSIRLFNGPVLGAGVSNYNFANQTANEFALTGEVGWQGGIYINNQLRFSIGGVYHIWGFPSETVGEGGYGFIEIGASF